MPSLRRLLLLASALIVAPLAMAASQAAPPPQKADSARKGDMDSHLMGPWKEMNAFHQVMAATWHPASEKNDLAPLRARAGDLARTADAWKTSRPPAMPRTCGGEPVLKAIASVVDSAKALAAMVASGAADDAIKASLKSVHDTFEVAEKACAGHGDHK